MDEFEQARKQIARLEARVFQEQNALVAYEEATGDLDEAQTALAQAESNSDVDTALVRQQMALDDLMAVPDKTIAGRLARQRANTADRDLTTATTSVVEDIQTNDIVGAAKAFAMQAAVLSQNPPHSAARWREIVSLWEEATQKLDTIAPGDPGYSEAQAKLAEYSGNASTTRIRLASEEASVRAFDNAKSRIPEWQAVAADSPDSPRLVSLIQRIINDLDEIEARTTPYAEAQILKQQANEALNKLRS